MAKMKEITKTLLFVAAAALLVAAASIVDPGTISPGVFSDQGELFYPDFTDPQAPKDIEVVGYDEATATAQPLKVEFKNNKWTIPSHYGYPADAEQRLASTAAALMELRKDSIISDRVEDQAGFGVIDPLDTGTASLTGRGKRVTLRDENGAVLADFIVGKAVEGRPGYRYMRMPGKRRTYAVKADVDVSARFEDWIETDLLKVSTGDIRKITIHSYSINEMLGVLENVENTVLTKNKDTWSMSGGGKPNQDKMDALLAALDNLKIVDVQPKPLGLTQDLKTPDGIRLSTESVMSLRQKGFFVTGDGQLFSNEGEVIVETAAGLVYSLRFGEIASGGAQTTEPAVEEAKSETSAPQDKPEPETGERRYLFITVRFSDSVAVQYDNGKGAKQGKTLVSELRDRFADWYYIISGADFAKLRPSRRELLK
jgi:hypothetical protein